jgi:hypothetical protein
VFYGSRSLLVSDLRVLESRTQAATMLLFLALIVVVVLAGFALTKG